MEKKKKVKRWQQRQNPEKDNRVKKSNNFGFSSSFPVGWLVKMSSDNQNMADLLGLFLRPVHDSVDRGHKRGALCPKRTQDHYHWEK